MVGPGIPISTAISGQKSTDDDDFIEEDGFDIVFMGLRIATIIADISH